MPEEEKKIEQSPSVVENVDQFEAMEKKEVSLEAPESEIEKEGEMEKKEKPKKQTNQIAIPPAINVVVVKSDDLIQIEKILEENIGDYYGELAPGVKVKFKQKGEETAREIEVMMSKPKFKAHSVLKLILNWLKSIPGINKFFLEKEAKIKTDKVLIYKKERDRRKNSAIL